MTVNWPSVMNPLVLDSGSVSDSDPKFRNSDFDSDALRSDSDSDSDSDSAKLSDAEKPYECYSTSIFSSFWDSSLLHIYFKADGASRSIEVE